MAVRRILVLFAAMCAAAGCGPRAAATTGPVPAVDWQRYLGRWHELARYDHRFERGLEAVTAEYALRPDGRISVRNAGRRGSPEGEVQQAEAVARIVGPNELSVTFFWPFSGAYRVLGVADDYRWAVVGSHGHGYLWYLHRSPAAPPEDWTAMAAVATAHGFDTTRLLLVRH